jgi:hypothetical protein
MLGLCYDLTKLYFYVTSPIPSAFFRIVGTLRSCAFCQPTYMFSTWYKRSSHCLEVFSLCTITVLTNPYSLRTWFLLAYAKLHSQYHVITWCPSYIDQLSFYSRPCLREVTNSILLFTSLMPIFVQLVFRPRHHHSFHGYVVHLAYSVFWPSAHFFYFGNFKSTKSLLS